MINHLLMYTDGSCLDNKNVKNKECKTGWSVVIITLDSVLIELYGVVELNNHSKYFLGAEIGKEKERI